MCHSAAIICLCSRFCAVAFVSPLRSCDERHNSPTIWNLLLGNLRSSVWQQSLCRLNWQFILLACIRIWVVYCICSNLMYGMQTGLLAGFSFCNFSQLHGCLSYIVFMLFACTYVFDRRRLLDMRRVAHSPLHASSTNVVALLSVTCNLLLWYVQRVV